MARREGLSYPEDFRNYGKLPQGKKPLFCSGAVNQIVDLEKLSLQHQCQNIDEEELIGNSEAIAMTMVDAGRKAAVKLLADQYDVKPIADKIIKSKYEESYGKIWHVYIPFEGDPFYLNLIDENQIVETAWFENEQIIGFEILDPTGGGFDTKLSAIILHITKFCEQAFQLQLDARDELISLAVSELDGRKEFIKKSASQVAKFASEGRLLTRNQKVPRTFETPLEKKLFKPINAKLDGKLSGKIKDKIHFALRETDFNFINEILWGMGLSLERCSNAVRILDEESLRDILKAPLNLHYSAVTGEAFNHTGKTDILVNAEDGTILYIAECKKYDGPKTVTEAITQLFKNLVWRDRMCSLIIFNINRSMSTAIAGVRKAVQEHPLFVEVIEEIKGSSSQYICSMKLSKDEAIKAKMIVQVFDLSSED